MRWSSSLKTSCVSATIRAAISASCCGSMRHGHHQPVNACRHRLYLPRGVAEQHRLLWPRTVNYTEIMGRGRLTGVGLPQDGALCQLLAPHPSSRPDAGSPRHRWSVLPERVQADESAFFPTTILLGTYGLDHRPLHRAASGLLAVIGPAASGKSTCCQLISKQHPAALIVDDLHLCNSAQLNDLQTILAHDQNNNWFGDHPGTTASPPQLSFLTGALQHGSHVLLRPTLPGRFDPFLVAPIPLTALPPGRGVLLQDGVATEFQLAQVNENVLPEHTQQWPTRRSRRAREHSG